MRYTGEIMARARHGRARTLRAASRGPWRRLAGDTCIARFLLKLMDALGCCGRGTLGTLGQSHLADLPFIMAVYHGSQ